jgi:hypothetical protein
MERNDFARRIGEDYLADLFGTVVEELQKESHAGRPLSLAVIRPCRSERRTARDSHGDRLNERAELNGSLVGRTATQWEA